MRQLNDLELQKTEGGFSFWVGCSIAALVVLAAGIIDGFTRPLKCHE